MDVLFTGKERMSRRNTKQSNLEEMHERDLGIVKMEAIARSFVYWKVIDNDIEEAARTDTNLIQQRQRPTGNIPVGSGNLYMLILLILFMNICF